MAAEEARPRAQLSPLDLLCQTLGLGLGTPAAVPEKSWGPRAGTSLIIGSEGKTILAIRASGHVLSSPSHSYQAWDSPAGGAAAEGPGDTGEVTRPLGASVSSAVATLSLAC